MNFFNVRKKKKKKKKTKTMQFWILNGRSPNGY